MVNSSTNAVTESLADWRRGDQRAADRILPVVYDELHRLAHHYLRNQNPGHTLQTTALVHEAYLRLVNQDRAGRSDRIHFVALAARSMRCVLVDHARGSKTAKRGGSRRRVPLDDAAALFESRATDLLALDEALQALEQVSDRQARIVEMRFFGGLTIAEAAEVLRLSERAVEKDWRYARAILRRALADDSSSPMGQQ
jgi:RNA polymerase sigma factor (TIGR02999 family)